VGRKGGHTNGGERESAKNSPERRETQRLDRILVEEVKWLMVVLKQRALDTTLEASRSTNRKSHVSPRGGL